MNTLRKVRGVVAIGTAAIALAACGPAQQATTTPGMSMPNMPASTSSSTSDNPVATDSVSIKNFTFVPASITVKAGTTVTWTNGDQDPHTVTSDGKAGPLNSKPLNEGDSYRYTFTQPGTYSYLCTIHPFMTATVTVTP